MRCLAALPLAITLSAWATLGAQVSVSPDTVLRSALGSLQTRNYALSVTNRSAVRIDSVTMGIPSGLDIGAYSADCGRDPGNVISRSCGLSGPPDQANAITAFAKPGVPQGSTLQLDFVGSLASGFSGRRIVVPVRLVFGDSTVYSDSVVLRVVNASVASSRYVLFGAFLLAVVLITAAAVRRRTRRAR